MMLTSPTHLHSNHIRYWQSYRVMLGQSDYEEQFVLTDLHCICDSAYYTKKVCHPSPKRFWTSPKFKSLEWQ